MDIPRKPGPAAEDTAASDRATDAAWVARARQGDPVAREALVRAHRDRAVSLAWRLTGDRDAAEDIAQEALVRALSTLSRFRGDAAFATWLFRIVVNEARTHARGACRRQRRWERQRDADQARCVEAPDPGDTRAEPLVDLMQLLPASQREALALFYLRELPVEDIARVQGAQAGTVRARLCRGRERLRDLARERGML